MIVVSESSRGFIKLGNDIATVEVSKIVPKNIATSSPFLFTVEKLQSLVISHSKNPRKIRVILSRQLLYQLNFLAPDQ